MNLCYDRGQRKGLLKVGEMLCLQKYLEASASFPDSFTIRITYSFSLISLLLKMNKGNSLVVQWLGLCVITAKRAGSIPGRGTSITPATQCSQKRKINETKWKWTSGKSISSTKEILISAKWWIHKQFARAWEHPHSDFARILPISSVELWGQSLLFLDSWRGPWPMSKCWFQSRNHRTLVELCIQILIYPK